MIRQILCNYFKRYMMYINVSVIGGSSFLILTCDTYLFIYLFIYLLLWAIIIT